jgi:hypothetical protein
MNSELARPPTVRFGRPEKLILGAVPIVLAGLAAGKASGAVPITGGELIVIAVRMVVPLLILRYWLAGGVVAMLLDMADVIVVDAIGLGGFGDHYAETDKLLDSYYYVLELAVAWRWAGPWLRIPAIVLFVHRLIGAVLFELLHAHVVLFIFPNLFENWWLYCAVVMKWFPGITPRNAKTTFIPLALLLIPKMGQEYLLHVSEAHPWDWTKQHVLEPVGINM